MRETMDIKNIIIIGSGPAAWTAALYAARGELKPVVFTGVKSGGQRGGQLTTTFEVENFPGFPLGVTGPELIRLMEEQARKFNIEVYEEDVLEVDTSSYPYAVRGTSNNFFTKTVIIATGAYAKKMEIPGHTEFWGKGISACAVCDGALPFFRNQPLAVIGGGDSACEEASFLTKYASMVYMIVRKDHLRASKIMQERVKENPKIKIIFSHTIEKAMGGITLESILVKDVNSGETQKLAVRGLFYAIGHQPNSEIVKGKIELDATGYIKVKKGTTHTSLEGIFAAGDVSDKRYRQAITAAGMGCMSALDAEKWLSENSHKENILIEKS
jgi:thioredoxin reductase (NADPH)